MAVSPPIKHPRLLRPFVLTALAIALGGSFLGLVYLLRIHLALGEVTPRAVQAHAQAQTFGFLLLFVAGFATFLIPRITAGIPLRHPRAALVGLVLLAVAAALDFASLVDADVHPVTFRALAVLTILGTAATEWALFGPLREHARRAPVPGYLRILELALAFLMLGALVDGWGWWHSVEGEALASPVGWATWELVIDGFAVGMAFGISARMFPGFLGIEPGTAYPTTRSAYRRTRVGDAFFWASVLAWSSGVLGSAVGYVADVDRVKDLGEWLFDAGSIALALRYGLAPASKRIAIDRTQDSWFPWGARSAYALLVMAAVVGAFAAAADLLHPPVDPIWRDVRRHLIALGFLMTLIAAMAGRLAPGYASRRLALPSLRAAALIAFPLSAVLRTAEGFAHLWGASWLLWISAASGPIAAAAFIAFAVAVGVTLVGRRSKLLRDT